MEGSNVLIHLVDASSAQIDDHIASVHKILDELNLSGIPRVLVFNKADLLTADALANMKRGFDAIFISALDRESLLPMIQTVSEMLEATGGPTSSPIEREDAVLNPIRAIS
jgi:GTP-binding protein HflX